LRYPFSHSSNRKKSTFSAFRLLLIDMYRIKSCLQCQTKTRNQKFCSSTCSTTYNNLHGKTGRPRVKYHCHFCGTEITYRKRLCDKCKGLIKTNDGRWVSSNEITKKEVSTNDTQKYRRIRKAARSVANELGMLKKCLVCSYRRYVECCHIQPIADYSNDTLVSVINHPDNLCGLCPNHHWELDHRVLKVVTLLGLKPKTEV
jgi:hypothetical protein